MGNNTGSISENESPNGGVAMTMSFSLNASANAIAATKTQAPDGLEEELDGKEELAYQAAMCLVEKKHQELIKAMKKLSRAKDPSADDPWIEHAKFRLTLYSNNLRIDLTKAYVLSINFVRDFIWAYLSATSLRFGNNPGSDGYVFFMESLLQAVYSFVGMLFVLLFFLVLRHTKQKQSILLSSWLAYLAGSILSLIPWNFGVFVAANVPTNNSSRGFNGIFNGAGNYNANLLSSIFTGLFEACIQLFIPWIVAISLNVKGARVGASNFFNKENRTLRTFGLFLLNLLLNSLGPAIWQVTYYLGATSIAGSTDIKVWPSILAALSTNTNLPTNVCPDLVGPVGIWAVFTLSFAVAFFTGVCNYLAPPLMEVCSTLSTLTCTQTNETHKQHTQTTNTHTYTCNHINFIRFIRSSSSTTSSPDRTFADGRGQD